jgi:hypothetical protein
MLSQQKLQGNERRGCAGSYGLKKIRCPRLQRDIPFSELVGKDGDFNTSKLNRPGDDRIKDNKTTITMERMVSLV